MDHRGRAKERAADRGNADALLACSPRPAECYGSHPQPYSRRPRRRLQAVGSRTFAAWCGEASASPRSRSRTLSERSTALGGHFAARDGEEVPRAPAAWLPPRGLREALCLDPRSTAYCEEGGTDNRQRSACSAPPRAVTTNAAEATVWAACRADAEGDRRIRRRARVGFRSVENVSHSPVDRVNDDGPACRRGAIGGAIT